MLKLANADLGECGFEALMSFNVTSLIPKCYKHAEFKSQIAKSAISRQLPEPLFGFSLSPMSTVPKISQ